MTRGYDRISPLYDFDFKTPLNVEFLTIFVSSILIRVGGAQCFAPMLLFHVRAARDLFRRLVSTTLWLL